MSIKLQERIKELELVYEELDFHLNYDPRVKGGVPKFKRIFFDRAIQIERFILHMLTTKGMLMRSYPTPQSDLNNIATYCYEPTRGALEFKAFEFAISNNLAVNFEANIALKSYNQIQQLFCQEFNNVMLAGAPVYPTLSDPLDLNVFPPYNGYFIQEFSQNIRASFQIEPLRSFLNTQQLSVNNKYRKYCKYIDSLFLEYSSLTFVSSLFFLQASLDGEKLHELKKEYFNKSRSVQGLTDMVGYLGKWECHENQLCFRVVFAFPSEKVLDANTLLNQIAFHWEDTISLGQGICNSTMLSAKTVKLKKLVCKIDASDSKSRDLFNERVVTYITKSEKYYMPLPLAQFIEGDAKEPKKRGKHNVTFKGH